ncbi:BTB and MATH domain-containing protein 38-like [Clytia hemisphaerica]|uniref:BTB and MATH domain-containing protein 38-like n=1 Tax=Clytia hemisphaerica TaxID=252671 RepID=UPI0034D6B5DF
MDQNFAEPWNNSDAVILVENEPLHVHKAILSMCSPVFRTMLSSDFKEGNSSEIRLPGKKKDKIKEMLHNIYPFPTHITDDTDVSSLLQLSREYQIDPLGKRVEENLLRKQSSVDLLLLAQEFQLKKVVDKCTITLSRMSFQDIRHHPHYDQIETENVVHILQGHLKFLKEQHVREVRSIKEQHNKKRQETLEIVNDINCCWGYNKLPIRGCTCPSYSKSCGDCNNALEKFIKIKCGELFEHLQGSGND